MASEEKIAVVELWEPDVIVSIDFGMTCTGVAYSMGPDWAEPRAIQNWPGMTGSELRNKVPSVVGYNSTTGALQSWGLMVDPDDPEIIIQELFKLFLDPAFQSDSRGAATVKESRQWFQDYLSCLYQYIKTFFQDSFPRWDEQNVEFMFSTPTTWRSPVMIAEIEMIIKRAGFPEGPKNRIVMSLTEAEAAAVYASKQQFKKDEIILVCDAGGGTTDLNVLKMRASESRKKELQPLSWVEGSTIGSTVIDYRVEMLITERLQFVKDRLKNDPTQCAMEMMRSRFEPFKRSFGSAVAQYPALYLPVPGLEPGIDVPEAFISDSKMILTRIELQGIFDDQIGKIFDLIDQQISRLRSTHPEEYISYLILSGGFGSSPYLRDQMRARYETGYSAKSDFQVLVAADPQLAVTFGMVMNRNQEVSSGEVIYKERKARNSYGIVCRRPYQAEIHAGEPIIEDPRDNTQWADRQIHWLIEQGQTVSVEAGVEKEFRLKLPLGEEHLPWHTEFVMSTLPIAQLPRSMSFPGVQPICTLEATIDPVHMKLKNRHWYQWGPKYFRLEFSVKVVIGPADLQFQVWDKLGQICNKEHDRIIVQWDQEDF